MEKYPRGYFSTIISCIMIMIMTMTMAIVMTMTMTILVMIMIMIKNKLSTDVNVSSRRRRRFRGSNTSRGGGIRIPREADVNKEQIRQIFIQVVFLRREEVSFKYSFSYRRAGTKYWGVFTILPADDLWRLVSHPDCLGNMLILHI